MDEIKRLQAEFQKAQESGAVSKLSERNMVQIVMKLRDIGKLDLLYTMDGKQYLTPEQLARDIRDELYVNNGRLNVVELHELVNVDLSRVEEAVAKLTSEDGSLKLIGQDLIESSYIDSISEEINELLMEAGQVSVGELCKRFNLPVDYLSQELEVRLGTVIQGQTFGDRGSIFTNAFLARQTAKIQGVFSAITKPTQVGTLVARYGFHAKLFYDTLSQLLADGRLPGKLQGSASKATYVPDLQQKTQDRWIGSFYKSNQYIEFDAVQKLGVRQPARYLKKVFPDGLGLETCHVHATIVDNINGSVGEALAEDQWVDIMGILPSPCTASDAAAILAKCPEYSKSKDARLFNESVVCSRKFVDTCSDLFNDKIKEAAAAAATAPKKAASDAGPNADAAPSSPKKAESGSGGGDDNGDDDDDSGSMSKKEKRDARKKKKAAKKAANDGGGGSSGGGGGGGGSKKESSGGGGAEQLGVPGFLQLDAIAKLLSQKVGDMPEEVYDEIAAHLQRPLTAAYEERVREAFSAGVSAGDTRREIEGLHKQYDAIYINASLYAAGAAKFPEGKDRDGIASFLLGDLGEQLVNILFRLVAKETLFALPEGKLKPEVRAALVDAAPKDLQTMLRTLNKALSGKDLEAFFEALGPVEEQVHVYVQKENTKKRDRSVAFKHQKGLVEMLKKEEVPAMVLHLVVVLLFQKVTSCMLSIPGKLVQTTINYLAGGEDASPDDSLVDARELAILKAVLAKVKSGTASSDEVFVTDLLELKAIMLGMPAGAAEAIAAARASQAASGEAGGAPTPPAAVAPASPAAALPEEPPAAAAAAAEGSPAKAKAKPARKKRMKASAM